MEMRIFPSIKNIELICMKTILKISVGLLFAVQLQSCMVIKDYQRPAVIDSLAITDLFRPEYQLVDSANIGLVEWQSFFTDPFLQKYIERSLSDNLDFAIAAEQIKTANAYYLQAQQAYYPSVSLGAGAGYSSPSLNGQMGQNLGTRSHGLQYELSGAISWEADIWGKLTAAKRGALADMQRTLAAQQTIQTVLVANIATTYYQLLVLDEQQKITQETIITRSQSWETTIALKDAGILTEVAVQQSEALKLNAEALLVSIEQQIKILENTFNLLLGTSSKTVERMRLDQQEAVTHLPYGVPYQLLSNRPDIRAAEYNLIAAFEMTNVAKANFYPSFKITASGGLQSLDFDKLFNPTSFFANILGNLTQPLWNKRQLRTQQEIADYNQQIAFLQYKKTILQAGREVSDALVAYESQTEIIDLKDREYKAYQLSTTYSQELVNYGLANYLEVLRSQENELNARLSLLNAQFLQMNAVVQLYKALGGGWK